MRKGKLELPRRRRTEKEEEENIWRRENIFLTKEENGKTFGE